MRAKYIIVFCITRYIQNSFLLLCFREWVLEGRTLHGSFLLEQKVIEQMLTLDEGWV